MTITELAETHKLDLSIKYSIYSGRWFAVISRVDIMEDGLLIGVVGDHVFDSELALDSLIQKIKGKTLVKNFSSKKRRVEFKVPETLTK